MRDTISIRQTSPPSEGTDVTIRAFGEPKERATHRGTAEAQRNARRISEHAPSPGQIMLLVGAIGVATVAVAYAFSRNRQQLLGDSGNINRRWDRADRVADTRKEDRRWERDRRTADQRAGLRSHAEGFAV